MKPEESVFLHYHGLECYMFVVLCVGMLVEVSMSAGTCDDEPNEAGVKLLKLIH